MKDLHAGFGPGTGDEDVLTSLEKALPGIRNEYAHGSYTLMPTALGIIELVHEIINQLFAAPADQQLSVGVNN